jgi:predicted dehydrogenase
MLDVLLGLFGSVKVVAAGTRNVLQPWEVEDSAEAFLELEGGIPAFLDCHWCSKTWVHVFEIIGTEARLKWDSFDSGPVLKTVGSTTESLSLPPDPNVHLPLLDDFETAIRLGRAPAVPLAEAYKTTVLLDAIYAAAGRPSETLR